MKKTAILTAILMSVWAIKAAVTSPLDYTTIFAAGAVNANTTQLENSTTFAANIWSGPATGTNPTIANSSLSYFNYKDNSVGKQISLAPQTARYSEFGLTTLTTDLTSGTFYLSFLLNVSAAPTSNQTLVGFDKSEKAGSNRGKILIKSATGGYTLTPQVSTNTDASASSVLSLNTTYLIVLKYVVSTASHTVGAGSASLFVNPTIGAAEPTPTSTGSQSGLTNMDYIKGFVVWQQPSLTATIAGLRYSNSWANAVPALVPVSTSAVTSITNVTATGNGSLGTLGTPEFTNYGICWKTSAGATISDNVSNLSTPSATGAFTAPLTGLTPNTTYFVNAFATNTNGTTYGSEVSFLTLASRPSAMTVDGITTTSLNVAINENGNPAHTEFALKENISSNYVQANGTITTTTQIWNTKVGWGTKTITGLTPNTSYDFIAKARNSAGTESGFSASILKVTLPLAPIISTASNITSSGFTANWIAPTQGNAAFTYTLEYGSVSDLSSGTTQIPAISSSALSNAISDLIGNTTYYYRINAVNATGSGAWSSIQSVTTSTSAPNPPINIIATAGNANASIAFTVPSNNGGSSIFDYTVTSNPDGLTATGASSPLQVTGLTNGTGYTFTVTARNSIGNSPASTSSNQVTPDPVANIITVTSSTNSSTFSLTPVSDVVVNNDVLLTINQPMTINSLTIGPGGMVTNASILTTLALTINSDTGDGTGTYINNGTSNVTTLIANQYLGTTRNWYVSSPVESTTSSATNISRYYEFVEAGNNADFSVSGSTAYWKGYNPGHTMVAGKGYIALPSATGGTVSFSGAMNTGEVSISLSKSGAGYNLIGNPYPSHLTWTKTFVDSKASQIEPTIWYRTNSGSVNSGGDAAWSFKTINASTGEVSPLGTTNIIPPMQAFWVKALATGTLILNSDLAQSHQAANPLKAPAVKNTDRQRVRLQVSNGTTTDETLIYFDAAASDRYDRYDSPKYSETNTVTQIFTTVGTEKFVINGMNTIALETPINVGFVSGNANTFSIKANELTNIPSGVKVILKDNVSMLETDLTDGVSAYQFSQTASSPDRFSLIFRAPGNATRVDNSVKLNAQVFVNAANQITIIAPQKSNYAIYNAVGQKVKEGTTAANCTNVDGIKGSGVYVVRVSENGRSNSTRVILNGK